MILDRFDRATTAVRTNQLSQRLLLLAIITFGGLLRFFKLGEWSFWGDEYITVFKAIDVFGGGFTRQSPTNLITHLILTNFEVNEFNARLVAVTVGILTIPIFYWIVKQWFDIEVAFLAALMIAISPWHLYWSQNARFYTALLLFYTLALFFFHRSMERDSRWDMVVSLIFFGLAAFERLTAAFLVPTILGYLILLKPLRYAPPPGLNWRNLAIYFVPGLISVFGIAAFTPTIRDIDRGLNAFGFVNNNPFWLASGVVYYVSIPFVLMGIIGAYRLFRTRSRLGLLLSITAVVPTISLMLLSLIQFTANRYAFVSLTAIIALAALALKELITMMPRNGKLFALGAVALVVAMPMSDNLLYFQYQNGNRDDWKAAFTYIDRWAQDDDLIITANPNLADFYLQRETLGMPGVETAGLETVLANNADRRIWVVVDLTAPNKGPSVVEWARREARFMADFDVNLAARTFPMDVYLYNPLREGERP